MLLMVIERFAHAGAREVYRRARLEGRQLPDGLRYVDSWVRADLAGCFQLMECDDPTLLQEWIAHWADLVDVTVVPVVPSAATSSLMARLDEHDPR